AAGLAVSLALFGCGANSSSAADGGVVVGDGGCWTGGADDGGCVVITCAADWGCPTGQVCCGSISTVTSGESVILHGTIQCEAHAACSPPADYQLCGTSNAAACVQGECLPTVGDSQHKRCR